MEDAVSVLVRLDPQYRIIFGEGGEIHATPDIARMDSLGAERVHHFVFRSAVPIDACDDTGSWTGTPPPGFLVRIEAVAQQWRPYLYTRAQLEAAETHDPYWNAAMREMRHTGDMHNYMRMYWGKKILEWSATPEEAFAAALAINNRYFLDGRDANSFPNIAWVFGQHDRPWGERPISAKCAT